MSERNDLATLRKTWDSYYGEKTMDTAIRDREFFALECAELVRALVAEIGGGGRRSLSILELGSGTGYLAQRVITALSEMPLGCSVNYTGVDLSPNAVGFANARCAGAAQFVESDALSFLESVEDRYDVILTQRSLMAVLDREEQDRILGRISVRLAPGGVGIFSEGLEEGLEVLASLRAELGLPPLEKVWHSLYLRRDQFASAFHSVKVTEFCSLYWLLTRVVYPHFSDPVHNSPFHRFAAGLPQVGGFGLVKLITVS